jgi:hypothetical protein
MTFIAVRCPHCQSDHIVKRGKTARGTQRYLGSVSKVEMAAPIALIYMALFPSISTFETPPDHVVVNRSIGAECRFLDEFSPYLGKESHLECGDADCDCHAPDWDGICHTAERH